MVRRKRQIVRFPRKQIPKIFACPKCGVIAVSVVIKKENQMATVTCGKCTLRAEIQMGPADQAIDIYCKFTDRFGGWKTLKTIFRNETREMLFVIIERLLSMPDTPVVGIALGRIIGI